MARSKRARSGRSAAQRRATAKLIAFNKSRRRVRRNPAPQAAVANPRRRRRRSSGTASRAGRTLRRYRRNPSLRIGNAVSQVIKPAVTQAVGGLVLDLAMGYIPLPAMLATGYAKSLTKVALAVGIGIVGQKVTKGATAKSLALGAATIAIHDLLKGLVQTNMPSIRLGGSDDMWDMAGLGYTNFAPTFNDDAGLYALTDDSDMGELFTDAGMTSMGELFDTVGEIDDF